MCSVVLIQIDSVYAGTEESRQYIFDSVMSEAGWRPDPDYFVMCEETASRDKGFITPLYFFQNLSLFSGLIELVSINNT